MSESYYIGLLSGTSMDAVDVALVSFESSLSTSHSASKTTSQDISHATSHPKILKTFSYPIPEAFRQQCLSLCHAGAGSIDDYGSLDAQAGEIFADAVLSMLRELQDSQESRKFQDHRDGELSRFSAKQIRAIGSHGQTLRHCPDANPPFTLQIGDPNIIAERTGIPTIADFRRRDMAAGGQGAPLAPAFHAAMLGSREEDRVIVNIGGISNITILHADANIPLIGFDTGPGNGLMDLWVKKHWNMSFDKDGAIAREGKIQNTLLQQLLSDPFFNKIPPKSTGRDYFNETWLLKNLNLLYPDQNLTGDPNHDPSSVHQSSEKLHPQDIQATLLSLTAHSIANAILQYTPAKSNVYICGGGVHNAFLMQTLCQLLNRPVQSTEVLGLPPDWIEAMLFAWLAKQTLEGKSGNCPTVTGAKHAIPLGGIFGYEFSNPLI
jgi:anhydro-N-acetylmuramic acid kinase